MNPYIADIEWVLAIKPDYVGWAKRIDKKDLFWYEQGAMTRVGHILFGHRHVMYFWSPGVESDTYLPWLKTIYPKMGRALKALPGPNYYYIPDSNKFMEYILTEILVGS